MDGNGRVVRCCVPVFLQRKGLLSKPFLFLSVYFEDHRRKYLDTLFDISNRNNWKEWILYFLRAVVDRSEKMKIQVEKLETGEKFSLLSH